MTTIRDVAKAAGVSITTVSRALNGYEDINEETRKRIVQIANELSYRPNAIARSLVKKESRLLGYIVSGLEKGAKHTIVQDSLSGVYEFANSIDYEILMFAVDSKKQQSKSYVQFAQEHSLAGIILQGIRTDDAYYNEVLHSRIPCVLIDLPADTVRVGCVSSDNTSAAREAVRCLIGNGHRNIAYLNGKDAAYVSRVRYDGYISVLSENKIMPKSEYILTGNFSEEEANRVVMEFLPRHPEVTAFFCASDLMAIGAMRAIDALGKRIPEEIEVIGFDDILLSGYVTPSLTTIRQDFHEMGREAARMLHNIIHGQDVPHTKIVPYQFIKRNSTR